MVIVSSEIKLTLTEQSNPLMPASGKRKASAAQHDIVVSMWKPDCLWEIQHSMFASLKFYLNIEMGGIAK